jgi:tetratricopeptide (TPR) repeat protein
MILVDKIFIDASAAFQNDGPISVTEKKLQSFLQATNSLMLPPSERLRQLAIRLESEEFEGGWQGIRQIFLAAARDEQLGWELYQSWGIIAINYSKPWMASDKAGQLTVATEGENVLLRALELSPANSDIAYVLGLLHYNHPLFYEDRQHYLDTARNWFARAVEWNPDNHMARLYAAHCHHDAGDWQRAIVAYSGVNQQRLQEEWPKWRAIKLREQLAYCYAKAGDIEEANRRFTEFLDYVEGLDEEALEEEVINLHELVMALREVLRSPSLLARSRQLIVRAGLETLYKDL